MALDVTLLHAVNGYAVRHDAFEDPVREYSLLSEPLFLAALAALFLAGLRRAAVAALATSGLAVLLAHVAAMLWNRPRPFAVHDAHAFLSHAADSSFPSDHATAAFAIAVAVLLRHRAAGAVLVVAAAALAFARVAMGVHYPSDVAAGALLGTLSALALWTPPARALFERIPERVRLRPA
jgi:undecaprenyl-diphosphatase